MHVTEPKSGVMPLPQPSLHEQNQLHVIGWLRLALDESCSANYP